MPKSTKKDRKRKKLANEQLIKTLRIETEVSKVGKVGKVGEDNTAPAPGSEVKLPLSYPTTDAGNAELLAAIYKHHLRYDHSRKRWLVWRKNWWSEDCNGQVRRMTKATARFRAQAAAYIDDDTKHTAELSWARTSESKARLDAALELARSEHPLADPGRGWDANPWLLGVGDGIVDLRTGTKRGGRPSDRVTLHTEIYFDREAQCPTWDRFLLEVFQGDEELVRFIQRAVGYCLTGDTSEQCLFLCFGTGANGKSTFLEVLRHVFSEYAYNLPFTAFELKGRSQIPNDIAALDRKRFVTAIETNESVELNEGRIKALTGCDPIAARHLYREFFEFTPQAKFWLAFNHKPRVSDDSEGFWRRIRLIPFSRRFEGETADKNLLGKLKAEGPGILRWALEGCLRWQSVELGMPQSVRTYTDEYKQENDLLGDFLAEKCDIDPAARVLASRLWAAYQSWAAANRESNTLSRQAFSSRLQVRGFTKTRVGHSRAWIWFGLHMRPDPLDVGPPRTDADVESPIVAN